MEEVRFFQCVSTKLAPPPINCSTLNCHLPSVYAGRLNRATKKARCEHSAWMLDGCIKTMNSRPERSRKPNPSLRHLPPIAATTNKIRHTSVRVSRQVEWRRSIRQGLFPGENVSTAVPRIQSSSKYPLRLRKTNIKPKNLKLPKLEVAQWQNSDTTKRQRVRKHSQDNYTQSVEQADFLRAGEICRLTRQSNTRLPPLKRVPTYRKPLLSPSATLRGLIRLDCEESTILRFRLSNYGVKDVYSSVLDAT